MSEGFLLSRVLLKFEGSPKRLLENLSAVALTADGSLWFGSDEGTTFERLTPLEPYIYGEHDTHDLADFVPLKNQEDEVDIEGMSYEEPYLWITGSHSTKRKQAKPKSTEKQIKKLATVEHDPNRYLIARIPVVNGKPIREYSDPDHPEPVCRAAALKRTEDANILIDALREDEHLGPFLTFPLPSKENGFDIEGLAVKDDTLMLGFRGPVLRGWAVIVEIRVEEIEPQVLGLKAIGKDGALYRKHFVHLNGLGIRELCRQEDDLIILGGPTLDMEGTLRIFRLKDAFSMPEDDLHALESDRLETLFDLPYRVGADRAEGLTLYPCLGQDPALMVVYDSPAPERMPDEQSVFADVYRLG